MTPKRLVHRDGFFLDLPLELVETMLPQVISSDMLQLSLLAHLAE